MLTTALLTTSQLYVVISLHEQPGNAHIDLGFCATSTKFFVRLLFVWQHKANFSECPLRAFGRMCMQLRSQVDKPARLSICQAQQKWKQILRRKCCLIQSSDFRSSSSLMIHKLEIVYSISISQILAKVDIHKVANNLSLIHLACTMKWNTLDMQEHLVGLRGWWWYALEG